MICAYLETWTAQEVFDKVATHLLRQGKQASNGPACMYLTADGLKCAAGCLIPDEEYSPNFEYKGWNQLPVPAMHGTLIRNLQNLHDHNPPFLWQRKLEDVAIMYNLSREVLFNF